MAAASLRNTSQFQLLSDGGGSWDRLGPGLDGGRRASRLDGGRPIGSVGIRGHAYPKAADVASIPTCDPVAGLG